MKYYLGTSRSRVKDHHAVRDALNLIGHEISYDWTAHGNEKPSTKERLQEIAILDLRGVELADFLIVLLPGGGGTHLEIGFAIASGKKIFLHSEDPGLFELGPQANAFYHHPDVARICCPLADLAGMISDRLACDLKSL